MLRIFEQLYKPSFLSDGTPVTEFRQPGYWTKAVKIVFKAVKLSPSAPQVNWLQLYCVVRHFAALFAQVRVLSDALTKY